MLALAGCTDFPHRLSTATTPADPPPVQRIGGRLSTHLDVLTYNVFGLPWLAKSGRGPQLREIAEILRELNAYDDAPDVVLFQEVFSGPAMAAVMDSGYPEMIGGPGRTQSADYRVDGRRAGKRRPMKGELGVRFAGSGLVIASRYPVLDVAMHPYSRGACAGYDCLSNKGVVLARIAVPGTPVPVTVVNTHMNARLASRVRPERHLSAHWLQTQELAIFLARNHDPASPVILGGDFNMREAEDRFDHFKSRIPLELVHQRCLRQQQCAVRMAWNGERPWMDTQDLQFFTSGTAMAVEPVRVEAMFDGRPGSPKLSDHDGFRVRYALSWKAPPVALKGVTSNGVTLNSITGPNQPSAAAGQ